MKAVIFAGGVGTRLWPLSRKKSPKQFERVIGDKSTLQLTVERLLPALKASDIYISTGQAYAKTIASQLPLIPADNIITEPHKRDVGPAVSLVMAILAKKGFEEEPVIILWSDHLVKNQEKFTRVLTHAQEFIKKNENHIVFIGQKPRFPSDNLGWIEFGECKEVEGVEFCEFSAFQYKPDAERAKQYFKDGHHCWNLGYFVSTPRFIIDLYKRFNPKIHELTTSIMEDMGKKSFGETLDVQYAKMPEINFDNAVLEQLDPSTARVIVEDIGWSDVGAWEALKEALEEHRDDNITNGRVHLEDSLDNLIYNYEEGKMVVGVDLENLLVVNTKDVLLVAKKTSVAKVKKIVESFQGTDNEHLT